MTITRWTRRGLIVVALVGALTVAARRYRDRVDLPPAPEVTLAADVDPIPAADIRAARGRVEQSPKSADAWGEYGLVLRAYQFFQPAQVCFQTAADLDPSTGRWAYHAGNGLAGTDPVAAIPWFERAYRRENPEAVRETVRLRLVEILLTVDRTGDARGVLGHGPYESPRAKLAAARLAEIEGDDRAALELVYEIADHPAAARQAALLRSRVELRQNRPSFAAYVSRNAAQIAEGDWPDPFEDEVAARDRTVAGQMSWARRCLNDGRSEDAEKILVPLAEPSRDPRIFPLLADARAARGHRAGALRALEDGIRLHPRDVTLRFQLGLRLFESGEQLQEYGQTADAKRQFALAVEQFDAVLALDPKFGKAQLLKGTACARFLGREREGIELLQRFTAERPEVGEGYLLLGQALASARRYDEAKTALTRALHLANPGDSRADQSLKQLQSLRQQ